MSATLTTSVRRRLARDGASPRVEDLYSPHGARFYDDLVGGDRSEVREFLALARRADGRILDLAAGTGRLTLPLLAIGASVTALDLSAAMLARLDEAAPRRADLSLVCGDMRDFSLEQRFDLIVLAATSITLLDPAGRGLLFDAVRRHLTPAGRFAFSVAGPGSILALRRTVDRTITVARGGRSVSYLSSQEIVADGAERIINFVPLDEPDEPILASRLHLLDDRTAVREVIAAGFAPPTTVPVRVAGAAADDMVILETSWPR
jgi:SAM-dependent methyltransferase